MIVYVITQGHYSDYHICAVTTDKDKAEILRKFFSANSGYGDWGKARIQEYDTEEYIIEANLANRGFHIYYVGFDSCGHFRSADLYTDANYIEAFNKVSKY